MERRTLIALGLVTATVALGIYALRARGRRQYATTTPWHPGQTTTPDDDDPFAEMIEEGAGLLGQMKAEAAELARKAGLL